MIRPNADSWRADTVSHSSDTLAPKRLKCKLSIRSGSAYRKLCHNASVVDSFKKSNSNSRISYLGVYVLLFFYSLLFLLYAETWAFTFDESYHLVAAQLIIAGKRPYLDFTFPQSPVNAYWNAWWMSLLGESWRVPHAFAALFTITAVALMARFALAQFPIKTWRAAAAMVTALTFGLNAMVFMFGPLSQAYGMCLFALVMAFLITIRAVDRTGLALSIAAGLFTGIAAGSTLLSAAAVPVFALWALFYNRAGNRWSKLVAFLIGTAIAFIPVIWLFIQGPKQTWFNLAQYHLMFRKLYWPSTTLHDLEVLTAWIDSGQALLIGLLAVFGLLYVARRSQWPLAVKAEFYLCGWLALALSAEVGRAHPTFERYFLLAVPFFAILAVPGLYAVASAVLDHNQTFWPVLLVAAISVVGLAKSLYDRHYDVLDWRTYEQLARKVDEVTPRNASLFATEPIYFLTHRIPPAGLELYASHKVDLGPADNALMHIVTEPEMKQQVQSGMFRTAFSCDDDEIDDYGLPKIYNHRLDMNGCSIFWDLKNQTGAFIPASVR